MTELTPVHIINLEHRHDRLLFMNYQLNELGIPSTRIDAINGKNLEDTYDAYMQNVSNSDKQRSNCVQSLGAFGLLLTYKEHVSKLHKLETNRVVIFEDDVFFHINYNEKLTEYKEIIQQSDVVWLGSQYVFHNTTTLTDVKTKGYFKPSLDAYPYKLPWGTYAMVYSSRFLKLLDFHLEHDFNKRSGLHNIDIYLSKILKLYPYLNGICLKPELVLPQVYDSDLRASRDIADMVEKNQWDINSYRYCNISAKFPEIYSGILQGKMCPRNAKERIDKDISNSDLSRIIENGHVSFVFIITSYNNEEWVQRNISSIVAQNYAFWRIVYVNDASTDKTLEKLEEYCTRVNLTEKITVFSNETNMGQAYGRRLAAQSCQDDEVCCLLDGDDWLYDDRGILEKLDALYRENDLLISYGQFYYYTGGKKKMTLSGKESYSLKDIQNSHYRHRWVTQHLRTVRAGLFKSIPAEEMQLEGEWLRCATDVAEMYWCLEHSQGRHMNAGFPTCVYNKLASLSYSNSYYNQDINPSERDYRKRVHQKLRFRQTC